MSIQSIRLIAYDELMYEKQVGISRKASTHNIRKWFNIPRTTANSWYFGKRPWGRKGIIKETPELGYVIGALLGDGCLYQYKISRNYCILVGDQQFTKKFSRMISVCTNSPAKNYVIRSKNVWFVKVNNYELYTLFKEIRQNLNKLNFSDKKFSSLFIEGFFDAEGCVKVIDDKWRNIPKICLDIANTNKEILELVQKVLKKFLGIEARFSEQKEYFGKDGHKRKKCYHLRIYKKEYIEIFFDSLSTTKINNKKKKILQKWLTFRSFH